MVSKTRPANKNDFKRMGIFALAMIVCYLIIYFLLGYVRSIFLPRPGSLEDCWHIGPIYAMRIGGAAFLTIITVPFVLLPYRKKWQADDIKSGTRYDATSQWSLLRRIAVFTAAAVLVVVYAFGLILYCTVSTVIGPEEIRQSTFFQPRTYQWSDIVQLTMIPKGYRSDRRKQNGPVYWIHLSDQKEIEFSPQNEGISEKNALEIKEFIQRKSFRQFQPRLRLRKRDE